MDEITAIINSFSRKYIKLQQMWLRDCIDYFKRENTGSNYILEDLEKFVYTQWLLFDIRDVDIPVLPENINEEKRYKLKDTITLQLLSVVDISRPKYSQIQKIRYKLEKPIESDVKENEFKESSKRCLQLTLTDGVREIQAFEYKPIKNINLNLTPGMKIQFIAPLIVRYGQIMLEGENSIVLLGGEVEEILISNAPENILAAALNLPLNDHPVPLNIINPNVVNTFIPSNNRHPQTNQINTMVSYLNKANARTKKNNTASKQTHDNKPVINTEDDEFDMLLEIENELHGQKNVKILANKPTSIQNKPIGGISKYSDNIFDQTCEQDVDYMLDLEDELKNEQSFPKIKSAALNISDKNLSNQYKCNKSKTVSCSDSTDHNFTISKKSVNVKSELPENSEPSMDVSFGIDTDLKSKIPKDVKKSETAESIVKIMKKYEPFKSPSEIIEILSSPDDSPKKKPKLARYPYINPIPSTSRQIFKETKDPTNSTNIKIKSTFQNNPLSEQISPVKCIALSTLSKTLITTGKFKVRARFKRVIEKLTLKEDKWHIKLQIEDSSGSLDLRVDYELINKLMGYTYEELKVFARTGGKEFKEALDTFKAKLQSLDGIIEISFVNKIPRLVNIL